MPRIHTITVLVALTFGALVGLLRAEGPQVPSACPHEPAQVERNPALMLAPSSVTSEPPASQVAEVLEDPYAGYSTWCAPLVREDCETSAECPPDPFHGGRAQRCVHPWWAKDDPEYRVCAIGYTGPRERRYRRSQIERVGRDRCNGKKECNGDVIKILLLEAWKESTFRPYVRHRLNPDLEANDKAWVRYADRYGHGQVFETRKYRNKAGDLVERKVAVGVELQPTGNRHYRKQWRWTTGLGLYGMVASGFAFEWAADAPPEVLCRIEIATEIWLRRARQVWPKIAHGLDCDRDGVKDFWGSAVDEAGEPMDEPSWYDMHNAVNVGRLCPRSYGRQQMFVKRARKLELDPYGPVRLTDLGTPVELDEQMAWAEAIRAELEGMEAPWD